MPISELAPTELLLLDTHVWIWASGEAGGASQLGAIVLPAIERAARNRRLFVSAASVWEIALKAQRGKVLVSGDLHEWVRDQRRYPGVRVLTIGPRMAIKCTRLPLWKRQRDGREHRDPNDRFIVSAARHLTGMLLTCDEEMLAYAERGHVKAFDAR